MTNRLTRPEARIDEHTPLASLLSTETLDAAITEFEAIIDRYKSQILTPSSP